MYSRAEQMINLVEKISKELGFGESQVNNVVKLIFEEECTIPFVARYRKEMTGSLDEVALRSVRDRYQYLSELETSKQRYLKVVEQHCSNKPELASKWPELKAKFENCATKQELEDLYLPFKPKRRTRALIAKEKGLDRLLDLIMSQGSTIENLLDAAKDFVTADKEDVSPTLRVKTPEEALAGASDILAERIAEHAEYRSLVRDISNDSGYFVAKKIEKKQEVATDPLAKPKKGKKSEESKYENYFDYKESIKTAQSHRIMAVRRGEAEKVLKVSIDVDVDTILDVLKGKVLEGENFSGPVCQWVATVVDDAYKRLISPSIETEMRLQLKNSAEEEAIRVFSDNLEKLLLLPPIPGKIVMGVDPGLRTGSKLACVDETGKVLGHQTVYPDPGGRDNDKTAKAKVEIAKLLKAHNVGYVAIGNGTGSREIGKIIAGILKSDEAFKPIKRIVVNEAGASVYSTDNIAREEFPDLDATIRSAISIARRLQDPLAELVKIDPRSIGVGQYQHDVNPTKLNNSLKEVVESCVNRVGVDANTASLSLLTYVSGIGKVLAKNIVKHREANGKYSSRDAFLEVSGFGPKAFQQAAGFLRIPEANNLLDNSGVHPERYELVQQIAKDQEKELGDLIGNQDLVDCIALDRYVTDTVGMPTLKDIAVELIKPGRDPREDSNRFEYSDEISDIEDLEIGMILPGTVTNVTNFGAFVDIGVHQDGLVHISELSNEFVDDPSKVVSVGQTVKVRVIDVDIKRRRISLSRKTQDRKPAAGAKKQNQGTPAPGNFSQPRKRGPLKPRQGSNRNQKKPQKQFTVEDLMAKFNVKS